MRLANPEYLWFLVAVPLLGLFIWFTHRVKMKAMRNMIGITLWTRIYAGYNAYRNSLKNVFWLLGLVFLIFAVVDPQIGTRTEEVKRKGVDVIIALDVSLSMQAEDIPPSRLEKAKYQIQKLISMMEGDRVGLVAFSGMSHPQCPLTLDYAAANLFLRQMDTNTIPLQGTAIGDAIRLSQKMFKSDEKKYKVLILFSDGEDLETSPMDAARDAANDGVIIHTVGVGTSGGGPIPIRKNTFKKDKKGKIVITRLSDLTLREIANIGNGKYVNVDSGTAGLEKIYNAVRNMQKKDLGTREFSNYEDRFQGFAIIAMIFFLGAELLPERKKGEND